MADRTVIDENPMGYSGTRRRSKPDPSAVVLAERKADLEKQRAADERAQELLDKHRSVNEAAAKAEAEAQAEFDARLERVRGLARDRDLIVSASEPYGAPADWEPTPSDRFFLERPDPRGDRIRGLRVASPNPIPPIARNLTLEQAEEYLTDTAPPDWRESLRIREALTAGGYAFPGDTSLNIGGV